MYGKTKLIELLKEDIPEAKEYNDDSFRYVKIMFTGLVWCEKEIQECIFTKHDDIREFGKLLANTLSSTYAEARRINDIHFSKDLVVTSENMNDTLNGMFYDNTVDGDEVFVAWIKRTGEDWKPCILGSKQKI